MESSLEALGTEYIDLYQVHWPDPATPIPETAAALADLVREGLIRHVGVSNYTTEQITEFSAVLPVETVQPPYHLFRREIEADLLPYAQAHDIGVLARVLAHPAVQVAIVGALTPAHLEESVGALDLALSPSELAEIDGIMAAAVPFGGPAPEGMT